MYALPQQSPQNRILAPSLVLITDPPYGVNLGNHHGAAECRKGLLRKAGGYEDSPEHFGRVVVPAIRTALALCGRGMVFGVPPHIWKLPPPDALGGVYVAGAVGRNKWGWSNLIHCLLYGVASDLNKGAKPTAIANNDTADEVGHPTTKPTRWMEWAVGLGAGPLDVILDPFMGSGTTGVACVKLGRRFIGIEIEPKYYEIALKRIEAATKEPRLPLPEPKAKQEALL